MLRLRYEVLMYKLAATIMWSWVKRMFAIQYLFSTLKHNSYFQLMVSDVEFTVQCTWILLTAILCLYPYSSHHFNGDCESWRECWCCWAHTLVMRGALLAFLYSHPRGYLSSNHQNPKIRTFAGCILCINEQLSEFFNSIVSSNLPVPQFKWF